MRFRSSPIPADRDAVRALVAATGFFRPDEVEVAGELVDERLARGEASGYHFLLDDRDGGLAGYVCFGPVPCTVASWDVYWVAVAPERQGRGLGRALLAAAEEAIRTRGGRRAYVETSTKAQYAATRTFYERSGYGLAARLDDYYDEGDGKAVYLKIL